MKYEYTYAELKNEMSVLENTFSIVRLVDPIICRVVHVTLQNDKLIFSPTSPLLSGMEPVTAMRKLYFRTHSQVRTGLHQIRMYRKSGISDYMQIYSVGKYKAYSGDGD